MAEKRICSSCHKLIMDSLLVEGQCNPCRVAAQEAEVAQAALRHATQLETGAALKAAAASPADKRRKAAEFNARQAAAAELANRELCKRHFLPFVQRFNPDYMDGWVHREIARELEEFKAAVERQESPRLMIFMPPRHGKSQLTSKSYAAWVFGDHPDWEFILASYSGSLANRFSREVRGIMRDPAYHSLFDTRLDPETQAVELWQTTEKGGMLAVGVGGPATGSGAHIFLIDDPVKNREEAESASIRQSVWDWYTSTAYTRLAPGGGIVLIMTRWHDDDLAGRLLRHWQKEGGEPWKVIEYPAVALEDEAHRKKGEALHPARYPIEALNRIRKVSDRDWWALYQQKPIADEGAYFSRGDFVFFKTWEEFDEVRKKMQFYQAWDLAIGTKEHNDYTVGICGGLDLKEDLWVPAIKRGRWQGDEICDQIIDFHLDWDSHIVGIERGQIEMAIGPFLDRRISERKAYSLYTMPLKTGRRDKMARARPIQGMARQKKIHLPDPSIAPWVEEFVEELLRFPAGTNDDQVDAAAWLGQMITEMSVIAELPPPKKASWKDKLDSHITVDDNNKSFMTA